MYVPIAITIIQGQKRRGALFGNFLIIIGVITATPNHNPA